MKIFNNYDEKKERKIRHIMCIFLALETLLLCLVFLLMISIFEGDDMQMLYYHEESLSFVLGVLLFFCGIPIILTALSMRFRAAYIVYEMLHCLLAGLLFTPIGAAIMAVRFFIYLNKTSKAPADTDEQQG